MLANCIKKVDTVGQPFDLACIPFEKHNFLSSSFCNDVCNFYIITLHPSHSITFLKHPHKNFCVCVFVRFKEEYKEQVKNFQVCFKTTFVF